MTRTTGVTGIVLAGGASRRMGRDKALLELKGRPLIAVVADRLRAVADEVVLVADDSRPYASFVDRCVPDVFPGVGTLGGIHAGLRAAGHDLALVVSCDMPFLDPALLSWFAASAQGADLLVLKRRGWVEPLHAVYHRRCLPAIEAVIQAGQRQAFAFYDRVRVRYVTPTEIAHLDPELRSFRNVNTPQEWNRVLGDGAVARRQGQNWRVSVASFNAAAHPAS